MTARAEFDQAFTIQTVRQYFAPNPRHLPLPDGGAARLREMAIERYEKDWGTNFLRALCGHVSPQDPEPAILLYGSSGEHSRVLRCQHCAHVAARALPRASDGLVQCKSCLSEHLPLTDMPRVSVPELNLLVDVPCCRKCRQTPTTPPDTTPTTPTGEGAPNV